MSPVIVALDYQDKIEALAFVEKLSPELCRLKVGKGMFTRFGPAFVSELQDKGFEIFLDLKFHDIPSTVADALKAAADLGVWMANVHALGGQAMLEAASQAVTDSAIQVIAVTILTSLDEEALAPVGLQGSIEDNALRLASLAHQSGLDGVVCSAYEARSIKAKTNDDFLTVTPGIRLSGDDANCQKRIMTPVDAVKNGSDYLVIGRSITGSDSPNQRLKEIVASLAG